MSSSNEERFISLQCDIDFFIFILVRMRRVYRPLPSHTCSFARRKEFITNLKSGYFIQKVVRETTTNNLLRYDIYRT